MCGLLFVYFFVSLNLVIGCRIPCKSDIDCVLFPALADCCRTDGYCGIIGADGDCPGYTLRNFDYKTGKKSVKTNKFPKPPLYAERNFKDIL